MISTETLKDIDKRVDETIPGAFLASVPRALLVIHILRAYEDMNRFGWGTDSREGRKLNQDALHFAILWAYQYGKNVEVPLKKLAATDDELYVECGKLLIQATKYSQAFDLLAMLYRKRATGVIVGSDPLTIEITLDQAVDLGEVADQLIGDPVSTELPLLDTELLLREAALMPGNTNDSIQYTFPKRSFEQVYARNEIQLESLFQLDPAMKFEHFTLGEFRTFWLGLVSRVAIHSELCLLSGVNGVARDSVVMVKSRSVWADELSRLGNVSPKQAKVLIDLLTFDPNLYGAGKREPDVTYQPFLPVGGGRLALSNELVLLSSAERNLWSLLSIVEPDVHGSVRNSKEAVALGRLIDKLTPTGLLLKQRIKYKHGKENGDVDLCIYDPAEDRCLIVQHKYPVPPDRIKECAYACSELQRGLEQAIAARTWAREKRQELASKIGLSAEALDATQIDAIVMSNNYMGGGHVGNPEIPILNERLALAMLVSPHQLSLSQLFEIAQNKSYLPRVGQHFEECDTELEIGGVKFIGKNLGMWVKTPWDPAVDIQIPSSSAV